MAGEKLLKNANGMVDAFFYGSIRRIILRGLLRRKRLRFFFYYYTGTISVFTPASSDA